MDRDLLVLERELDELLLLGGSEKIPPGENLKIQGES
jgi:hypothetical protein